MIKTLNEPGLEGNFLDLVKTIYKKPIANITLNDETVKAFTTGSGAKHR